MTQVSSGIPATVTRAEGSLLQRRHGRVGTHRRRSGGVPHPAHPKELAKGPPRRGEGERRRRKRSGPRAEGDRDGHRPSGQVARGHREDTGGEVSKDLLGQDDIRRRGISRVAANRQPDPPNDTWLLPTDAGSVLRPDVELAAAPRNAGHRIEEHDRHGGRTDRQVQAGLLANTVNSDLIEGALIRALNVEGRRESTTSAGQGAIRGDASLRHDVLSRRTRGVRSVWILRAGVGADKTLCGRTAPNCARRPGSRNKRRGRSQMRRHRRSRKHRERGRRRHGGGRQPPPGRSRRTKAGSITVKELRQRRHMIHRGRAQAAGSRQRRRPWSRRRGLHRLRRRHHQLGRSGGSGGRRRGTRLATATAATRRTALGGDLLQESLTTLGG